MQTTINLANAKVINENSHLIKNQWISMGKSGRVYVVN